jgi:hypothetical protein
MQAVHSGPLTVFVPGRFFQVPRVDRLLFSFQRWKAFHGVLFPRGESGVARLELFVTEAQLAALLPARVICLVDCVAIRIATTDSL